LTWGAVLTLVSIFHAANDHISTSTTNL